MTDLPILPNYAGANVRGIVPDLLAPFGAPRAPWMPRMVTDAEQVVLLVVDGLGWDQLSVRPTVAPTLAGMQGGPITTVAPSTTATALTSIATGLTPGEHGLLGYRLNLEGDVVNVLRWSTPSSDARKTHPPKLTQPFAAFLGHAVPVVSKKELEHSAFTEAHLRGSVAVGWRVPSNLAVLVADQLRRGERLVYAYYDGIDKVAHEFGFGEFYDAELRTVDRLVADLLEAMPAGSVLLVTADHGQVHVGSATITPDPSVQRMTRTASGEGRFRWLHARRGAAQDLADAATSAHGDVAWIVTREQVLDEGWFGPTVSPPVAGRLGDVAMVARADVSFDDPADSGAFALVCRHGSLTSAEMWVPLIAATA